MNKNHYSGKIVEGDFPDRVYLDSLEYSLQKHILDDFKGEEIVIEFWITTEPLDYFTLDDMDIDFNVNGEVLRMYTQFRTVAQKKTLASLFGTSQDINNRIGNYIYLIATIY
jgi:hypothetical protein